MLNWAMPYIADLHVHSRYAYATSKNLSLESLAAWAKLKGIDLLASADFTHPAWLEELRSGLEPSKTHPDSGLYEHGGVHFVLGTEVSCIFRQGGRSRRVHLLLLAPDFETVETLNRGMARYGRLDTDGRPSLSISALDLVSLALEANRECIVIPAHLWTPWYGALGSKSGFDSLEECFGDMLPHIHAVETGLSSDPPMNWEVPELDHKSIVSFSDAHSAPKLGREVTAFEGPMSYPGLHQALKDRAIAHTVEFYPEEGKYHYSGHRKCGVVLDVEDSLGTDGICPRCERPLTLGVKHRISVLSQGGGAGVDAESRPRFMKLLPLQEILAQWMGVGTGSKKLHAGYVRVTSRLGGELRVLTEASREELGEVVEESLADLILAARNGHLVVEPGYDGVYGKVRVITGQETIPGKSFFPHQSSFSLS